MTVTLPVARIAGLSWWQRFRAHFDVRGRAELLALVAHERALREARDREIERLEALILRLTTSTEAWRAKIEGTWQDIVGGRGR